MSRLPLSRHVPGVGGGYGVSRLLVQLEGAAPVLAVGEVEGVARRPPPRRPAGGPRLPAALPLPGPGLSVGQIVVILTAVPRPCSTLPHPRPSLTIGRLVSVVSSPGGILAVAIVTRVVSVKRRALATVDTIAVMIIIAICVAIGVWMAIG